VNVKEPVTDGCLVRIGIELSADEIQPQVEAAFEKIRKSAKLPGFRPGKIPTTVIKQRFGKEVREEAADEAIKEKLPDALKETGINPLALAPIEDLELADDGSMSFTAVLEIAPEFDAYAWKDKPVERLVADVTDDDVDRHIDTLRRDHAVVAEATADDETSEADRLTVGMQQVDDSGVAIVGNKRETTVFELGSGYMGADADEKLVGMKIDETRRIEMEEIQSEIVDTPSTGSTHWDVHLKSFEKVELPEVNDDFAAQIDEKFEKIDDFKKNVRDQLTVFAQYQANQRSAMALREAVIGAYDFDLPPSLLGQTLGDMVQRQTQEMGNTYDPEQLRQFLAPIAHQELTWFFIRRQLLNEEKIEASDTEIEEHVENYHKSHPETDLDELKEMFKTGEKRDQLADEIIMGKVMEVLRNGVKWEDKPISFMDVLRDAQAQHGHYHDDNHEHDHDHAH
jgi:trigger factor